MPDFQFPRWRPRQALRRCCADSESGRGVARSTYCSDCKWTALTGFAGSILVASSVWEVDSPATLPRCGFQIGIGIDGERMLRNGKHIGVPSGIAKSGVNLFLDDFT